MWKLDAARWSCEMVVTDSALFAELATNSESISITYLTGALGKKNNLIILENVGGDGHCGKS